MVILPPQPQTMTHYWGPIIPEPLPLEWLRDCHTARDTYNCKGLLSEPGVHQYHLAKVQPTPFLPLPPSQVQNNGIHKLSAICQGLCCFPSINSI